MSECSYILMPLSIQWYREISNRIWQGSRYSLRSENQIQPRDLTCGVGFLGTGLSQATQLNYGLNSSSLGGLGCSHSESKSHLSIGMIPALRSLSRDHVGLTTTVAWLRLCDSCRQVATDYIAKRTVRKMRVCFTLRIPELLHRYNWSIFSPFSP